MKPLLLVFSVLLGGVLLLQWHGWSADEALPAPPAAQAQATARAQAADRGLDGVPLEPPPKEDYATVVERPLFLPERRPPPEEAEEPVVEEEPLTELDGVDLTAVVITPAVVSAWVRSPGVSELKRLRLGDDFEGWTVKTIAPDELVLERQGETNRLSLHDYENAPPPIPPTRLPAQPRRGTPPARQRRGEQEDADGGAAGQAPEIGEWPTDDWPEDDWPTARRQSPDRSARPAPVRSPSRQVPRRPPTRQRNATGQ